MGALPPTPAMADQRFPSKTHLATFCAKRCAAPGIEHGAARARHGHLRRTRSRDGSRTTAPQTTIRRARSRRVLRLDGPKLADSAAPRWDPPLDRTRRRHAATRSCRTPATATSSSSTTARRAALVDPAGIPANLLRILRDGDYHLHYILITHKHADHCDATADVAAAFPDAQIVMHELDVRAIGSLADKALRVRDGETLPFGDASTIRMLHTPGHTDGSSCYIFHR